MNLYQYTATHNPNGSREIVESYGIRADRKMLPKQLASVVARHGQEALDKVTNAHPDLPLFQKKLDNFYIQIKKQFEDNKNEPKNTFSNIDGQALKSEISSLKDSFHNATGSQSNNASSKHELLIIGGILVIGLAIIFKNK